MDDSDTPVENKVELQLKDIIQIEAPDNDILNEKQFVITYISIDKMKICNLESLENTTLMIDDEGNLHDDSILSLSLISRANSDSFAHQNNLIPDKWIDIHFGGDVPEVLTGEITSLESDMIEIRLYPNNEIIYIDFAYKGIPENLPINKIDVRSPPESVKDNEIASLGDDVVDTDPSEGVSVEDMELFPEEDIDSSVDIKNRIKEFFIKDDDISFGEDLDEIIEEIRVDDDKIRFSVENQTNDLLNDLLSTIPNAMRTQTVLSSLHKMIERYRQVRSSFSDFDQYGNAIMPKIKTSDHKPLIKFLQDFNRKLYWILPIVKNTKKLYDMNEEEVIAYSDVMSLTLAEERYKEAQAVDKFYSNVQDGELNNKYIHLLKELNPLMQKHTEPFSDEEILVLKETNNNIIALVDNLGDYYSSISNGDNINRRKFLLDTYTTSLQVLERINPRSNKFQVNRKKVIPNSLLPIKSLLFLNESVLRYSRINLPETNILTRANLNTFPFYYFDIFKKNSIVDTITIDSFENSVDHKNFLGNMREYILEDSIQAGDKYNKYLDTVIPRTKEIFELMKKYISGKLSLYSLIGYLEPFGIYISDLTYKQYEQMNRFIKEKIHEYKKDFAASFKTYRNLHSTRGRIKYGTSGRGSGMVTEMLDIKQQAGMEDNIKESVFYNGYDMEEGLKEDILSRSEIIKNILESDGGLLFMTAVSLTNSHLLSAININDQVEEQYKEFETSKEEQVSANECKKYIMTKRYKDLDELTDDNNKDIFFDKKLDPTRYEVIEEYSDKRQSLSKRDFKTFLVESLKTNVGLNDEDALEDAEAMIEGKRVIKEGHYAALEIEDQPVKYYERREHKWVIDESLPSVSVDSNELFCNMQSKCFSLKGDCIDKELSETAIKHKSLDQILKEFDVKYEVSKETLVQLLSNRLMYYSKYVSQIRNIRQYNNYKYDKMYYTQGIPFLQEEDKVVSPYEKYYHVISGQQDFIKKMNDMYTLCSKFTREAIEGENKWYRYCIETNLPLVPLFQWEIASTWHWSGDINDYNSTIARLKKTQGKISDDGDSWVDEHSGEKICDRMFDTEEGYEDGYKMVSREILEAELSSATIASESQNQESSPKSDDPDTKICLIVVNALSKYMGININDQTEFIISNTLTTNNRALGSKSDYENKAADLLKRRNKTLPDWETINTQSLIILTLSYMIVGIQISVPSIKTRKVFPGCIKSLDGYPLDGSADFSTVDYISCIVGKISSGTPPWNTIKRLGQKTIAKLIKSNIDKFVLTNDTIMDSMRKKMEWSLLNSDNDIPIELSISNWETFMPPLVPIELKTVQNITDGFKDSFLRNLKTANKAQREQINIIQGKIQYFASTFLQKVQDIIKDKKALLTNSASEPFVENVCCQEGMGNTVINYFMTKDPSIISVNENIELLSNIMYDIVEIPKSVTILSLEDTRLVYPKLTNRFSEDTIYLCFLKFCNYENDVPIPDNLIPYCFDKPENHDKFDDLSEKIRKLKRDGKNFSESDLESLLRINNQNNLLEINFLEDDISDIQKLRNFIAKLDEYDLDDIPQVLRERLSEVLDVFSITVKEDPEELKTLTNYLHSSNERMRQEINSFLKKSTNMKRSHKVSVKNFIENFAKFDNYRTDSDKGRFSLQEDESIYRSIEYTKNCIYELTKVYSNIVINECDYSKVEVPRYWKLSSRHENKVRALIKDSYGSLSRFYKDEALNSLLTQMQINTVNINLLVNQLVCFSSIIENNDETSYALFNKKSITKLMEFCFLSIIREHIVLIDQIVIKKIRKPLEITSDLASQEQQNALSGELVDELEIVSGETLELSSKVATYLAAIINIFINTKKEINYSYQDMMDQVNRHKESEKDAITKKLKDLSDEQREVNNEFKKHKLGDWGLGLQKGLTQYVADFYDNELDMNEESARKNKQLDDLGYNDEIERGFASMDLDEQTRIQNEIDMEEMNISHLPEDDDHGDNDDVQYGY